ncbi:MAG: N-6 DNA methylase, partial [Chloroflexi bacterium]|nr:N-6 DNA methylase [Chloroflexota bacterium]
MAHDARQHFETQLSALVEKFTRRREEYTRADYSELQARIDFIDPFFEALGWDVRNTQHASERARDVVVESGATRGRPDYNFRLNGQTQFFVEAKAPHVALESSKVILQAKRYAFNETSQTVILAAATDFEEFRLYEVRDISYLRQVNKGRVFAYRYDEYLMPRALDDLWKLSRESVAAGSLDALVSAATRRARERVSLDQQFLSDLADWRERLAKAIFKNHPELDARDLNSVVQVFLDRLIFIRVAEDRGVLPEGQLIEIARHWRQSEQSKPITAELLPLFRSVNRARNGEIFKPHKCEELGWDSAIVAAIIDDGLEPYNFAQIGVELLGSIYERYLGKTIRVTATRAIVEDKPEVRKAGGVYYTPKHIVDYIVAQTVGKWIEGKTPKQIEKLRVLDPACGSGSFLLGAYQTLLDYHTRYFAERADQRGGGGNGGQQLLLREPRAQYGEFKLTLEQKGEILRNNIFGVDIDPQAVEITMMSL